MTGVWTIRPVREEDFPLIAATQSAVGPEPWSVDQVREWDEFSRTDADYPMTWFVAVDGDGRYAGWGHSGKAGWLAADEREVYAAVLPELRGGGAGAALLSHAETLAAKDRAAAFLGWCMGLDDSSLQWALRRGYTLERQRTEAVLDLSRFDAAMAAGAVSRAESHGIRIRVLNEEQIQPYLGAVYRVHQQTFRDVPFRSAGAPDMPYDSWLHETLGSKVRKIFVLAFDGEAVVGSTNLFMPAMEGQSAGIAYTGVLREYRGRGIAFALKSAAAQAGKEAGAKLIRTNNDPDNPAILAVNAKMGFTQVPGPRILRKVTRFAGNGGGEA